MSHESLSLCTESLGCETGTRGDFLDLASFVYALPASHQTDDAVAADFFSPPAFQDEEEEEEEEVTLRDVQYHRARPQRAFPPPLPSMSRRRGDDAVPCLRVRPHRRDGRLVLEAVATKPQGYLHAQREDGRLKLCFVDCSSASDSVREHEKQSMVQPQHEHQERSMVQPQHEHQERSMVQQPQHDDDDEEEEEEEEDEVEVVDRGTVVEVAAPSGKAQRCSRIVINKFVGGAPAASTDDASPSRCLGGGAEDEATPPVTPGLRRVPSSTTTLAAAVAAASTGMQSDEEDEEEADQKGEEESAPLLFTSRVGDREELMQSVRRCRQLRQRPLFIVEPYSIIAA